MKSRKLPLAALKKQLEFHQREIGKHRDALNNILSDMQECVQATEEACESLQCAIDRISETM